MDLSISSVPKFYYKTECTAIAVANSKIELMKWWESVKNKAPFNQLVADRIDEQPNMCLLRVRLGDRNKGRKITDIFQEALVECKNIPSTTIKSASINIVDLILKNRDKVYEIEGQFYQISNLISSQGCYGDVFLACNTKTKDQVAIKILRVEGDLEHEMLQKIARYGSHPNIVQYIGCATIMDKTWIVMEYINGKSIDPGSWTNDMREQYVSALEFMQEAGVTTARENEKENVLISTVNDKQVLKLIDFGTLARN